MTFSLEIKETNLPKHRLLNDSWIFAWISKSVTSLRLLSLDVPDRVARGQGTRLTCGYDLEGDTLYSIKWYRDDVEFFRYVPTDRPPGQFFSSARHQSGFDKSRNGSVFIRDISHLTAGVYKCEISADAPSFQTVSAEKPMSVQGMYFRFSVKIGWPCSTESRSKQCQHLALKHAADITISSVMVQFLCLREFFSKQLLCALSILSLNREASKFDNGKLFLEEESFLNIKFKDKVKELKQLSG
ncbi:ig-like domain-containing protein [Caerostris extrusa]|uniref:Ig-like domain-containing protein n=1 Tax=Caerostris extrusa TaxID=172846 RepID=A0AAV4MAV1_CAEEX|nr:ig-like domain-containing protein [Caerostris extrusa]